MSKSSLIIVLSFSFLFSKAEIIKTNSFPKLLLSKNNSQKSSIENLRPEIKISESKNFNSSFKSNQIVKANSDEIIVFISNNKFGFKDKRGKTIVPAKYDFADAFVEGSCRFEQ